jgi:hypothetical protein
VLQLLALQVLQALHVLHALQVLQAPLVLPALLALSLLPAAGAASPSRSHLGGSGPAYASLVVAPLVLGLVVVVRALVLLAVLALVLLQPPSPAAF